MRMTRLIAVVSTMAIFVAACGGRWWQQGRHQDRLGQLLRVEADGRDVRPGPRERGLQGDPQSRPRLAPRARTPAFEQGQVDLVPEYVGSGLGYYDKSNPTDATTPRATARPTRLPSRRSSTPRDRTAASWPRSSPSRPARIRTPPSSDPTRRPSLNLAKMSDLAAVQDQLKWGLPPDCDKNPLCKGALEQYGITYPPKQREALAACDAPIAEALKGKAIDFAWLCSTQPAILVNGFIVLEDDKKTQPADNIAPVVRRGLPVQGRRDRVRGAARRRLGQDDDRRAAPARRRGRRQQPRRRRRRQGVADGQRPAQQVGHRVLAIDGETRPATGGSLHASPRRDPLTPPATLDARMTTARDRPPEEAPEDTSFARGLRVFLTIADRGLVRADELATLLDTPLSTVYRYLRTLTEFGFVDRRDGAYQLGPRLLVGGGSDRQHRAAHPPRRPDPGHAGGRDPARPRSSTAVSAWPRSACTSSPRDMRSAWCQRRAARRRSVSAPWGGSCWPTRHRTSRTRS